MDSLSLFALTIWERAAIPALPRTALPPTALPHAHTVSDTDCYAAAYHDSNAHSDGNAGAGIHPCRLGYGDPGAHCDA